MHYNYLGVSVWNLSKLTILVILLQTNY